MASHFRDDDDGAAMIRYVAWSILAWCAIVAWSPNAHAQDGGVHGYSVNGPQKRIECPALFDGGAAICFRFDNGDATAARKALKVAPLAEHWQKASEAAAVALVKAQGQVTAANNFAKKNADRADEATKAADASKQRADSLQKAMSGQWFFSLLKIALPSAGALTLGYMLGRYVR